MYYLDIHKLIYSFKIINEYIRIALPSAFAGNTVNKGGVGLLRSAKRRVSKTVIPISRTFKPYVVVTPNAFFQAASFANVLQTFYADVGDADMMWHKIRTDKHLIEASFLKYDASQHYSFFATKTEKIIVKCQIFIFLSDGYNFAEFVSGLSERFPFGMPGMSLL